MCFAVDGLDDLIADALADHLVPMPVDHVRPRLQLPAADRTPEHARCLPVRLDFELDLAATAARLPLHEHFQPLVPDWKLPFGSRLFESARARGDNGSESTANTTTAAAVFRSSRALLTFGRCVVASYHKQKSPSD
jgi:hypothetical protein